MITFLVCSFRNDDLVTALHNSNQQCSLTAGLNIWVAPMKLLHEMFLQTTQSPPRGSVSSCCGAFVLKLCSRYSNFLFLFEALWCRPICWLKVDWILLLFLKTLFPSCDIQGQKSTFNFNVKNSKSYFVKLWVCTVIH